MNTKLWYEAPASSFCDALPIGSGSLGAMVYGCLPQEKITLNLDTLWSGFGKREEQSIEPKVLEEAKILCKEEKFYEAQSLIESRMLGQYNESYMPLGSLHYKFLNFGHYQGYKRELDLENGEVKTSFTMNGDSIQTQVFASYPDQAIVLRIRSEKKTYFDLEFWIDTQLEYSITSPNSSTQRIIGNAPTHVEPNYVDSSNPVVYDKEKKGMPFVFEIHVLSTDGEVVNHQGKIRLYQGTEISVILVAASGYQFNQIPTEDSYKECLSKCEKRSQSLLCQDFENLWKRHLADYRPLFQKSILRLGKDSTLPTDQRLEAFKAGQKDLGLYSLYYQFNRYLLISSSRPGSQPANLQGIWSESIRPVWSSNWTININTEMNYWPAGVCNLVECFDPLLAMLEEMKIAGEETAKKYFHCRGWVANHNIDIWRQCEPVSGLAKYAYWPMGGVWLSAQIFDYYLYTQDQTLLQERIYPVMLGSARFCLDWLTQDKDGYFVTPLATSPENVFLDNQERVCSVSQGSTMDIALIKELFRRVIQSAEILGIENEFIYNLKYVEERLRPYHIGKYGQLIEWAKDFEEIDPSHRHFSALVGFHPGTSINEKECPELVEGVRKSLERKLQHGGGHIGWSCAWLINFYARLGEGDKSLEFLDNLLKNSSYYNLFDLHPPLGESVGEREVFQIDGNFGGASGIASMLLRSCYGELELLPALPSLWTQGEIKGLLAEGGVEIDLRWENHHLKEARLFSTKEKEVKISYHEKKMRIRLEANQEFQLYF